MDRYVFSKHILLAERPPRPTHLLPEASIRSDNNNTNNKHDKDDGNSHDPMKVLTAAAAATNLREVFGQAGLLAVARMCVIIGSDGGGLRPHRRGPVGVDGHHTLAAKRVVPIHLGTRVRCLPRPTAPQPCGRRPPPSNPMKHKAVWETGCTAVASLFVARTCVVLS